MRWRGGCQSKRVRRARCAANQRLDGRQCAWRCDTNEFTRNAVFVFIERFRQSPIQRRVYRPGGGTNLPGLHLVDCAGSTDPFRIGDPQRLATSVLGSRCPRRVRRGDQTGCTDHEPHHSPSRHAAQSARLFTLLQLNGLDRRYSWPGVLVGLAPERSG